MAGPEKKTPATASEFEREQLRFFLSTGDLRAALVDLNPSLAWLPMLNSMKVIKDQTQIAPWIEKNFSDIEAVKEVVASIGYFGPETADILEHRLNRVNGLSLLLEKSWRLIIRHMRMSKQGSWFGEWFDLAPRLKREELTPEVLDRFANLLRPRLQVRSRYNWYDKEETVPEHPSDLMRIDFEVDKGISEDEVLSKWPKGATSDDDERFLARLSHNLQSAVEDAAEAGVEENFRYSATDSDVPSVAKHRQNAHHHGFLPLVRVTAEIWTLFAHKDQPSALRYVATWSESTFKIFRRLALFAAADPAVPANDAAAILLKIPQAEYFITNTTVEVSRLMRKRWTEFTEEQSRAIELRLMDGPPKEIYREDAGIEDMIDRARFDALGNLQRWDYELSPPAKSLLSEIAARHPQWILRPVEQAGFHIWSSGVRRVVGDTSKFSDISDDDLIGAAKLAADNEDFLEGNAWAALCQSDAPRAFRGLHAHSKKNEWPAWAWNPFLWAAQKVTDPDTIAKVAQLLLQWPKEQFGQIAPTASWWLSEKAKDLDEKVLWALWDRIEKLCPRDEKLESGDE